MERKLRNLSYFAIKSGYNVQQKSQERIFYFDILMALSNNEYLISQAVRCCAIHRNADLHTR